MNNSKNIAFAVRADGTSSQEEYDQAWKWADWMRDSLKMMSSIYLGDFRGAKPHVEFYKDDVQFFDPNLWEIHLGTNGIVDLFHPETKEEFVEAVNYVYGHEEQHLRSTTDEDYAWGIQRGCEVIVEYIASEVESSKKRFRCENDYADYANHVLPSKGIYINWKLVQQMVAGLANSLEDGRIERIRPKKFPGFSPSRKMFRSLFWSGMGDDYQGGWKNIKNNPIVQLQIISNQVLSLATCQLYQPGFKKIFAKTQMMKTMKTLSPHIAKAVASATCKGMSKECVQICTLLAPLFYEACKMSASDTALQKMLEELVKAIIMSGISSSHRNGRSKRTEEIGKDDYSSLFHHSDLEVTLPDDVYDELVKDAKPGSGITIKREHPKEKAQEASKTDENASAGQKGERQQTQESNDENPSFESDEKRQTKDAKEAKSLTGSDDAKGGTGGGKSGKESSKQIDSNGESDIESIIQEAKEAAKQTRENAIDSIDATNRLNAAKKPKESGKIKGDKGDAIDANAQTMKDLCPRFKEIRRNYTLKEHLPSVLQQRGKVLHRKNERYLRSVSTPNRTRLTSGSIDPGLITGLAYGDTDIFRKKGRDRKFNGCVYILVDNSGSMSGVKRKSACAAAAVIEEGFGKLMPVKIVAFDAGSTVVHEVVKDWEETSKLNMSWNFFLKGREGGGNEDGYDIMIATRELLSRPEDKKLLIILSDGAPGDTALVKKAVEDARKKGIKVCSIYFEEGEIERDNPTFVGMYQRDYICCSHKEIDKHLEKMVRQFSRN